MGILELLIIILLILWALGFAVHVGGGLIHLLLIVVVVMVIVRLVRGPSINV